MYTKRFLILITLLGIAFFCPTDSLTIQVQAAPNTFDCTTVSEIPQIECEALVALYESTDGPNWDNTTGWLVTNTPCSWHGITCDGGQINQLRLQGSSTNPFGLQGDLPPEIGNLSNLTSLSLYSNQLSSVPTEIGNLSNLTSLYISENQLNSLPPEIGNLSSLTVFHLRNNQLSSLPPEIGKGT